MPYTVIWAPAAEDKLAEIWLEAPDQQAVADAANRIDRSLHVDPLLRATSFYGDWLLLDLPLAVISRVLVDDCKVEVLDVWHQ
jgi:hypothetical protein